MAKAQTNKQQKVSIVVPVYADWDSLEQCIKSLILHATNSDILLVNDCGPVADEIEKNIKAAIKGHKNFSYFRNSENLGFVKTCNRAVFELDKTDNDILLLNSDTIVTEGFLEEMLECLYAIDRHGVVVPRSNNATLATVPLRQLWPRPRDDLEYAYKTYLGIKQHLPKFGVVPVGPGFCMLIRRSLIKNFGLFDEVFGKGYNEENDFCLRINKYGYSSVMSNWAFVYHLESRSFSSDLKAALNEKNGQTLLHRYPYYPVVIERYFNEYIHPIDSFADAIVNNETVKILINLYHFPLSYNGTTKNGLSFLEYLKRHVDTKKYEITVLCQKESAAHHKLDTYGFRLVYPDTIKDEVFHISYCPSQIFHVENLIISNKHSLRNVFSMLDIISLRCQYLLSGDIKQRSVFLDSLRWADSVITISDFTAHDVRTYFDSFADEFSPKLHRVHQGYPGQTFASDQADSSTQPKQDKYVLLFGNDYAHKAIKETLPHLERLGLRAVVIGPRSLRTNAENIEILPSGNIPDETISQLLEGCEMVIFPSQYEGFGFPTLEAAHYGKPLLYFNSEVGDEIAALAKGKVPCESFALFEEIPVKIQALLSSKIQSQPASVRSLDDYNRDVWRHVENLAQKSYDDFTFLTRRWEYFANVREYYTSGGPPRARLRHRAQQRLIKELKKNPDTYYKMRTAYRKYKKPDKPAN